MNAALWYIRKKFPDTPVIDTDTAKKTVIDEPNAKVLVVDCRRQDEFEVSRIPEAVNVHFRCSDDDLVDVLKKVEDAANTTVINYCSLGYRSAIMTDRIRNAIEKDTTGSIAIKADRVFNLEGSIFKWANEDKPLVDRDGEPTK